MPLDEFIIRVYCEICEAYVAVASTPLRRRGFAPAEYRLNIFLSMQYQYRQAS